jgi:hypothetical protein
MNRSFYPSLLSVTGDLIGIQQCFANSDPLLREIMRDRFKLRPVKSGYVYLLRDVNDGSTKIGMTYRPLKMRMYQLKQQTGATFEFVHAMMCHDIRGMEQSLHYQFKLVEGKKINKGMEYFRLLPGDLERIRSIKTYNGIPICHVNSLDDCTYDHAGATL